MRAEYQRTASGGPAGGGGEATWQGAISQRRSSVWCGCIMSFEDIVAQVKAHPELWLPSHEHYRHRVIMNRAWKHISTQLNTNEITAKKRWKHLKDQYRKEIKKILSNQITKSHWQHYNEMSFISSEILMGKSYTKRNKAHSGNTSDSDTESDELQSNNLKEDIPSFDTLKQAKVTNSERGKTASKKLYLKSSLKEIKELIVRRNRIADDDMKQWNDPDFLFLMSLLPTLRGLSQLQKLQFRGKINDWLIEAVTSNDFVNQYDDKISIQDQIVALQTDNL